MKFTQNKQAGFTLVEIIVVTIVIGILAAISVLIYADVQRRTQNTKVLSSVANWQKIIQIYQAKNKNKLPDDWTCLGMDVTDFPVDSTFSLGAGMCERGMIVSDVWTSEYKVVPPQPHKPTPTPVLLRQNSTPGSGAMGTLSSGNKVIKGIIYAAVSNQTHVSHPGAYIFYGLDGQACPPDEAHNIHGRINICARALTPATMSWIQAIDVN